MIKDFQKKHGLQADGILGTKTALKIAEVFKIPTAKKLANFLGQCQHESRNFTARRESMDYSTSGLIKTFSYYKKRPQEAEKDGRNSKHVADQQTIANKVYWDKNRSGGYKLGNPNYGDGWKYRGNAMIQLTGGENHKNFSDYVEDPEVLKDPDIVWQDYYIESGLYFFDKARIWAVADDISLTTTSKITKMIQGGNLHVTERHKNVEYWYNKLKNLL